MIEHNRNPRPDRTGVLSCTSTVPMCDGVAVPNFPPTARASARPRQEHLRHGTPSDRACSRRSRSRKGPSHGYRSSSQAHDKRVQKIAGDAGAKVAADAPNRRRSRRGGWRNCRRAKGAARSALAPRRPSERPPLRTARVCALSLARAPHVRSLDRWIAATAEQDD